MISEELRMVSIPKQDWDGNVYDWDYDYQKTGDYKITLKDLTPEDIKTLEAAITPGNKAGIHTALERLSQIKPIGSSQVKQNMVISYLCADLLEIGVSEFVVNEVCRDYRRNTDSKFFPDHTEFLKEAKQLMKKYKTAYEATKPQNNFNQPLKPEKQKSDEFVWTGPRHDLADRMAELRKNLFNSKGI